MARKCIWYEHQKYSALSSVKFIKDSGWTQNNLIYKTMTTYKFTNETI